MSRGSGGQIASSSPSGMSARSTAKGQDPKRCSSRESVSESDPDESLSDLSQMELFACVLCNVRRKFDDLSEKDMFCKECLDTQLSLQCAYCRCEFLQHFESTNTICVQCKQNERELGKPITCECCNLIAAFDGSKCDRCLKKIAKYGEPMPCLKCKLVAAFNRIDISKPAGRLFNRNKKPKEPKPEGLCWLCAQQAPLLLASILPITRSPTMATIKTEILSPSPPRSPERLLKRDTCENNLLAHESEMVQERMQKRSRVMNNDRFFQSVSTLSPSNLQQHISVQISSLAPVTMNSSFESNFLTEDQFVSVTQLKEEIHSLNRKIKAKDQEIIKMQVQITELRSEIDREQRESSRKSHELQRQHSNKMEKLQIKFNKMTREIADLKKTQTKNKKQPSVQKAAKGVRKQNKGTKKE